MGNASRTTSSEGFFQTLFARWGRRRPSPRQVHVRPARATSPEPSPPIAAPTPPGEVAHPATRVTPTGRTSARAGADEPAHGSCPNCHVPYLPAGTADRWGCPHCGRHAPGNTIPAGAATAVRPDTTASAPDRRQQELLAAWMLGQSVACPKCKSRLRRLGPGAFVCASCGHGVGTEVPKPAASAVQSALTHERSVVESRGHPVDVARQRPVGRERRNEPA
ncbi:MAG TPA: hypothetical protein VGV89_02770 [Thermoplasmata archaeon]|nr:hypothetical protein [Thermoplasmata archaeon]